MAWEEQLNLAATPDSVDGQKEAVNAATDGVESLPSSVDGCDEGSKAPKLPRWTRRELVVLIQGKRVAENNVRRGRVAGLAFGSGLMESKWASVSSYCNRHGVSRGPVPCRKRWSNLMGDFKKIREWESKIRGEMESFWIMRNDLRRERNLPVFFDKEVYDILDGGRIPNSDTASAPTSAAQDLREDADAVFDNGWSAAEDDGPVLNFDHYDANGSQETEEPAVAAGAAKAFPSPIRISEQQNHPEPALGVNQSKGMTNEKRPPSNPHEGSTRKRKRTGVDGDEEMNSLHYHLIDVLERNGKMVVAKLEDQNTNFRQEREQRKDNADNLVAVLNRLADAIGRIADKL